MLRCAFAKKRPGYLVVADETALLIFKGVRGATGAHSISSQVSETCTRHRVKFEVTENGWMTESSMINWIDTLPSHPASTGAIIVLDLFSAHRTETVLKKLTSKGYTPFFIPGGMTGQLQVHDVYVNKPFKKSLFLEASEHMHTQVSAHNRPKVERTHIVKWARKAVDSLSKTELTDAFLRLVVPECVWPSAQFAPEESPLPTTDEEIDAADGQQLLTLSRAQKKKTVHDPDEMPLADLVDLLDEVDISAQEPEGLANKPDDEISDDSGPE